MSITRLGDLDEALTCPEYPEMRYTPARSPSTVE